MKARATAAVTILDRRMVFILLPLGGCGFRSLSPGAPVVGALALSAVQSSTASGLRTLELARSRCGGSANGLAACRWGDGMRIAEALGGDDVRVDALRREIRDDIV